jgi:gamma-glutamylcyclotransferase (GGCT)/AIG2-like uncharacterized protein YtfP
MNLFVYGTLRNLRVWDAVTENCRNTIPGTVSGWKLLRVKNKDYPGLIPGDSAVGGLLILNISQIDLARLDRFEGDQYTRVVCVVESEGKKYPSEIYAFRGDRIHELSDKPWNYEDLNEEQIDRLIEGFPSSGDSRTDIHQ